MRSRLDLSQANATHVPATVISPKALFCRECSTGAGRSLSHARQGVHRSEVAKATNPRETNCRDENGGALRSTGVRDSMDAVVSNRRLGARQYLLRTVEDRLARSFGQRTPVLRRQAEAHVLARCREGRVPGPL